MTARSSMLGASSWASDTTSSFSAMTNTNTLFSLAPSARDSSAFHESVMLISGLNFATYQPNKHRQGRQAANLILCRARVKLAASLASHSPLPGKFVRAMADLQRLDLVRLLCEEDALFCHARWQSSRHHTFTGARFSFLLLVTIFRRRRLT